MEYIRTHTQFFRALLMQYIRTHALLINPAIKQRPETYCRNGLDDVLKKLTFGTNNLSKMAGTICRDRLLLPCGLAAKTEAICTS
jgi:hypothetical protein